MLKNRKVEIEVVKLCNQLGEVRWGLKNEEGDWLCESILGPKEWGLVSDYWVSRQVLYRSKNRAQKAKLRILKYWDRTAAKKEKKKLKAFREDYCV